MEDNRAEQVEALQALVEYSPRLIGAMKSVVSELNGNRQPDTDEYMQAIVNGMNWEIQVLNGTLELVNEKSVQIDKAEANDIFVAFSDTYQAKDDAGLAAMFETKVIPFFERLEAIAAGIAQAEA
ncbi:MAG: molecular chaperone [Lachnospiraceae bacterium]|nr:molecular chaperone [Lachnospiraceae bacterium]